MLPSLYYGEIKIKLEDGKLRLYFEHSKELSATLTHWHFDVWEIEWDNIHAWFDFGTLKFDLDNADKSKLGIKSIRYVN